MAAGAFAGVRTAGRPGGKSGLHGNRAPGNARRGSHVPWDVANLRESATESRPPAVAPRHWRARVKGCGKSAPRPRQRGWHGKPRPEQGRIGAARPAFCRAGHVSGPAARVGRARRMATCVPDEWPSPILRDGGQNPAYRLAGHFFIPASGSSCVLPCRGAQGVCTRCRLSPSVVQGNFKAPPEFVIPAQAGIQQVSDSAMDPRFRGDDEGSGGDDGKRQRLHKPLRQRFLATVCVFSPFLTHPDFPWTPVGFRRHDGEGFTRRYR